MSATVRAWCACGWHGEYRSQAIADYASRKHSCERWEAKRASKVRGIERRRAVEQSRVERPCEHPNTQHEHGTHAAYVLDRCRCLACTEAQRVYNDERQRANAYGRSNLVDAEPVRAHVAELRDAGMGLKTLSVRSGVSTGTLTKLVYGIRRPDGTHRPPARRVLRATADKLLAVCPDVTECAPAARVDATGTRRRLRALVSAGWPVSRLEVESGVEHQALRAALNATRPTTTAATALAVRELFERLWCVAPPETGPYAAEASRRARARGEAEGWPMPADLDDETLDDPHAPEPTRTTDEARLTASERLDEWLELVRGGEDPNRAAARAGYTAARGVDAVRDAANKAEHTAVLDWLDLWLIESAGREAAASDALARYRARHAGAAA